MHFPVDLPVRLEKVEELTGIPISTTRKAIRDAKLKGVFLAGSWMTTLADFMAWVQNESEEATARIRVDQKISERVPPGRVPGREVSQRTNGRKAKRRKSGMGGEVPRRKKAGAINDPDGLLPSSVTLQLVPGQESDHPRARAANS